MCRFSSPDATRSSWVGSGPTRRDIGLAYFDGTPAVRLTKSAGGKEHVSFSPDGKRVAFVRGANLFAVGVDKPQEEHQLTGGRAARPTLAT